MKTRTSNGQKRREELFLRGKREMNSKYFNSICHSKVNPATKSRKKLKLTRALEEPAQFQKVQIRAAGCGHFKKQKT